MSMTRSELLARLDDTQKWDVLVIGGGATGLGVAVDSASRGYRTLLLEQADFGQGTSSRSTKLIHGGVRYLRQGNLSMVLDSLRERSLLLANAPHLVHKLALVVPAYRIWDKGFYGIGLKLYDQLAASKSMGRSQILSRDETLARLPGVRSERLRGGVQFYDGQFDDSRLLISLVKTLVAQGGLPLNYMRVKALRRERGKTTGVVAVDQESGKECLIRAAVVVNATGVFGDSVRRMDNPLGSAVLAPSQGIHIVLDRSFLPGDTAMMIPKTDDGRLLFAIPWHHRVLIGTTDTQVTNIPLEPKPLEGEVSYLLEHAARYLEKKPGRADVLSVFAGLRPLVDAAGQKSSAALSRDHRVDVLPSGLVSIAGGKWTTYRKMAEDTVNQAARVAGLVIRPCITQNLKLHGWCESSENTEAELAHYGSDAGELEKLLRQCENGRQKLHPDLPYYRGEVTWAVRHEMARIPADILARRMRALFLDARASIEMVTPVAQIMAHELGYDADWVSTQQKNYCALAQQYLPA